MITPLPPGRTEISPDQLKQNIEEARRRAKPQMIFRGVLLYTRTMKGDLDDLIGIATQIGEMRHTEPCNLVTRIYVDDKNCAYYEIDLADHSASIADEQTAPSVRNLMRNRGG